jgi:hypothetical protein
MKKLFTKNDISEIRNFAIIGYQTSAEYEFSEGDLAYLAAVEVSFISDSKMCSLNQEASVKIAGLTKDNAIYINTSIPEFEQKSTLVHEYLHIISKLVTGDIDKYHKNIELWGFNNSAEFLACQLFGAENYAYKRAEIEENNISCYGHSEPVFEPSFISSNISFGTFYILFCSITSFGFFVYSVINKEPFITNLLQNYGIVF